MVYYYDITNRPHGQYLFTTTELLENGGCNDLLRDSAALSVVCFLEMEKEERV